MDEFTKQRVTHLIATFKQSHGRDISAAELSAQGVTAEAVDFLVRHEVIDKYQVTTGKGNLENRYKLHRNWLSLRD